ncbi:MAG: hypothetical protein B6242_06390 [Anaerolineaceae bacterium 4572_78]|nr:MAG: hypothetical protein B6242_06390 [Anaerolineaceae bacterium 4572_78]
MLTFSECTLVKLDKRFGLKQIWTSDVLNDWLNADAEIVDWEINLLNLLRESLILGVHDWNEFELKQRFVAPIFAMVHFTSDTFNLFAERNFAGTVESIEMQGKPDGIIASGVREPEKPYFCFQEYKKERDPKGDPAGQALAAMLVAQEINEHKHPIYGCHAIGDVWRFMTLQDKHYSISGSYAATRDDIFDIFRILKTLKLIIIALVEKEE